MFKRSFIGLLLVSVMISCNSSVENPTDGGQDNFNRQEMLSNWADHIIVPAYEDLNADLNDLVSKKNEFLQTPDQTHLEAIRNSWLNAYETWQYVEMFSIGKAEDINYAFQMNIYPTNIQDIQDNISLGTYDLTHVNNNDAVGFPAVDYMLFGLEASEEAILEAYTSATLSMQNKSYLSDLIDQMQSLTELVLNDWKLGYRDAFVNNASNTATSSTNKLTNDFIYYYEKGLRANKFGIPAGVFSTSPFYDKVEAFYYQEASKKLSLKALQATQDFFNGKAYGAESTSDSFKTYLQYLQNGTEDVNLSSLINDQFNVAKSSIESLDNNFSAQIKTDNTKMTQAYDELQKAVVLLKVDMIQAMNISVDFVDADGD
jgi:predicted lipoprotein